jgi:hypothetical protein
MAFISMRIELPCELKLPSTHAYVERALLPTVLLNYTTADGRAWPRGGRRGQGHHRVARRRSSVMVAKHGGRAGGVMRPWGAAVSPDGGRYHKSGHMAGYDLCDWCEGQSKLRQVHANFKYIIKT